MPAPELLHRLADGDAILQSLKLGRRRLVQVIDLGAISRDKGMQRIEFFGIAQLFRAHDLADLLGNGHGLGPAEQSMDSVLNLTEFVLGEFS